MSCAYAGSVNYPFDETQHCLPEIIRACQAHAPTSTMNETGSKEDAEIDHAVQNSSLHGSTDNPRASSGVQTNPSHSDSPDITVVCRRGNDSQHVVQLLRQQGITSAVDLVGGLAAWSRQTDPSFPEY